MTETQDQQGLRDLYKERTEWCQTNSGNEQTRTELQPELPYHNWVASSRSSVPPDVLVDDDGVGVKMAAMQTVEHAQATPTAIGRSLNQSYAVTAKRTQC